MRLSMALFCEEVRAREGKRIGEVSLLVTCLEE
jgi:hypothetical protein